MKKPTLWLNGKETHCTPGQTILEAARENGADIPTLCHLAGATPTGACRMCLVGVDGARTLVASCTMPAADGMKITTDSEKVHNSRKLNVELRCPRANTIAWFAKKTVSAACGSRPAATRLMAAGFPRFR